MNEKGPKTQEGKLARLRIVADQDRQSPVTGGVV